MVQKLYFFLFRPHFIDKAKINMYHQQYTLVKHYISIRKYPAATNPHTQRIEMVFH